MRAIILAVLLVGCSKPPAGPPLDERGLPTADGAWYRCDSDDVWLPVVLGADLFCYDDGWIMCPKGDCRIAQRDVGGELWALDLKWEAGGSGSRYRPVRITRWEVYHVHRGSSAVSTAQRRR